MSFESPWLLLLAVAAAPVLLAGLLGGGYLAFSSTSLLPSIRTVRTWLWWLPSAFWSLATICFAVAVANPQTPDDARKVEKVGISIALILDKSFSMAAIDLDPENRRSRLDVAKDLSREFVIGGDSLDGRPSDEFSVVTFAAYADTLAPPTLDHVEVARQLAMVEYLPPRHEENSTNLAVGLRTALTWLATSKAESKVVVLLTDGSHNFGEESPMSVASAAARDKVTVFTIGVGSKGMAPMPRTINGEVRYIPSEVNIDEQLLRDMAQETGGRYFRATNRESLRSIYKEIDRMVKTKLEGNVTTPMKSHAGLFVISALIVAAIGWLLAATWLRRLPA